MRERAAFLDFDGTLSKGFISMSFLEFLHAGGFYSDALYNRQMKIYDDYNEGKLPYVGWCKQWGLLWAEGFKGKGQSEVSDYASNFFEGFKHNVYSESFGLIDTLKRYGYRPLLISVGAYEVLSYAANALGITKVYATKLEIKNGTYTGKIELGMHIPDGKARVLKNLSNEFDMVDSFAFGDSVSDKQMFDLVGIPIVLNASRELKNMAKEKGWKSFDSKDVIAGIISLIQQPKNTT